MYFNNDKKKINAFLKTEYQLSNFRIENQTMEIQ